MVRRRTIVELEDDFAPLPKVKLNTDKSLTALKVSAPFNKQTRNGPFAMGTANWYNHLSSTYPPCPADIKDYYGSHVTRLRTQMENDPARLNRLIQFARYGMESNNIFSGIRFDAECHVLLEEFLSPYILSFGDSCPGKQWHVHTAACDIDPPCVKHLCQLSMQLDDGDSCVFPGLEGRVPSVHLKQFTRILGT